MSGRFFFKPTALFSFSEHLISVTLWKPARAAFLTSVTVKLLVHFTQFRFLIWAEKPFHPAPGPPCTVLPAHSAAGRPSSPPPGRLLFNPPHLAPPALPHPDITLRGLDFSPFSPQVAVVIHDDRGGADAPALVAVPMTTLTMTLAAAVQTTMPRNTFGCLTTFTSHMSHCRSIFHLSLLVFIYVTIQEGGGLTGRCPCTFFSLTNLWVWSWSNYGLKVGRFSSVHCLIMWALWSLLTGAAG